MKNICELITYVEEKYSEKTAFQWYDNNRKEVIKRSYAEFSLDIERFCSFLADKLSAVSHKHIAIVGANSYHYIVAFFGCLKMNAVAIPMSIREPIESICSALVVADTDYVLTDLQNETLGNTFHGRIAAIDAYGGYPPAHQDAGEIEPDELCMLMKTSGTTSRNRFVMYSHQNLLAAIDFGMSFFDSPELRMSQLTLRVLHVMPLNHVIGISTILGWCKLGKAVDLCPDIRFVKRDNDLFHNDYVFAVPMMLDYWRKEMTHGSHDYLGTIKGIGCGGATADPECIRFFIERGIIVTLGYGLSETSSAGAYNPVEKTGKYTSVGMPWPGIQMKLVDGEICFRGTVVALGYYKDPEGTAEAFRDGWFHTGDLGYLDEDGDLYITGRKKNLIILSNGENVSPEELEALLLKNESIREVLVKEKNDRICAEIFCDAREQAVIEAYINQINKTLPYYKQIVLTEYRTEPFERTASGKIKR